MSHHRLLRDLALAVKQEVDPGASTILNLRGSTLVYFPIVTAAAESRTLGVPQSAGLVVGVSLVTDGGDLTLTVTNGFERAGTTNIVFDDAGDSVWLISIESSPGVFRWRLMQADGITGPVGEELQTVNSLAITNSLIVSGLADLNGNTATVEAGSGILAGTGTIAKTSAISIGGIITTSILIDLTGLESEATLADIIGDNAAANCHFGQITAARSGTILGGRITCLEAPAGGEVDIDLYSATVATGVEGALITNLTETALLNTNVDWTIGLVRVLTAIPPANDYLYLTVGTLTTPTAGTYTAGKFLIEFFGYDA